MVPIFKNWRTTFERVDKFLSDTYFTDVNLHGKIVRDTQPLSTISHLNITTNPQSSTKDLPVIRDNLALPIDVVIKSPKEQWAVIDSDSFEFGPTWSVHWFKISFTIPDHWLLKDNVSIELQWRSGCEVLVYTSAGTVIHGLNSTHSRISVPIKFISKSVKGGDTNLVYLQASCSDLFGAGDGGMIRPPAKDKKFKIEVAKVVLVSKLAVSVARDMKLLLEIAEALKKNERGHRALNVANEAVNTIVDLKEDNLDKKLLRAQDIIEKFFLMKNSESQLTLHAMGHCHIDSAWLWRYCETRRKVARSWSNTLRLLESHPNMSFVCSQAQQLDWLKEDFPDLFRQLKQMHVKKQFLPVGGLWVEMDVNMPCCESLCRQFLYGQRFFKDNFGSYCKEFWLPDTFGYSPQLPQIMKQANISRFMTQKLSWSLVNKFPHHTFWWCGIDGSKVLTHFPPGDSYSMKGAVSEILHTINNFSDKGRSSSMMYVYGHGDGGQGPTEEMLHALNRLANCDGLPKIEHSSPDRFFTSLETHDSNNLCTWVGELFLELHNGTYTTQRQIKKGNSRCEQLLRVVEFLISSELSDFLVVKGDQRHDSVHKILDQLESKWKILLLNQFHDVLPGSSIEEACDDAYWALDHLAEWCLASIKELTYAATESHVFNINPTSWPLVIPSYDKTSKDSIGFCSIPPHTVSTAEVPDIRFPKVEYTFNSETKLHRISNQFLQVDVDEQCRILSLVLMSCPELGNLVNAAANELFLYDDVPLYWDAWDVMDYHLETGVPFFSVASFQMKEEVVVEVDDIHAKLTCLVMLGSTDTAIEKTVSVYAHLDYVKMNTKVVKWNEAHKFLKVRIPTKAIVSEAHYSTQAGLLSRPSHRNTSWDSAKFEVCSQQWLNIGEANWGIAILKEAIFGSSVMEGDLYLSLLRSPTSPDATADRKHLPHLFSYAIYPHSSIMSPNKFANISVKAAQFCWLSLVEDILPLETVTSEKKLSSRISFPLKLHSPLSGEVCIDWIKPSCDDPRMFVIRIHENVGGRHLVRLKSDIKISEAFVTDILETLEGPSQFAVVAGNEIEMRITPFQIISIAVKFSS